MKKFKGLFEQHREVGRYKSVKPHVVKPVGPRSDIDSANAGLKEGTVQDTLNTQHQTLRKKSGLPHPDYYKELGKSYDIEDHEQRSQKQKEIRAKYGQQRQDESIQVDEDLRKWFDPKHPEGGWKRINSKGEAIGPCAREPGEAKPKCMSNEKRASLTKKERASAVASKRRHDPDPDRKGEPINVSNYGKGKLSEENKPTNPDLWSRAKALARSKFDVYPSAYANGWAAKWYKSKGGGWKSVSEETELEKNSAAALTYKEKPNKEPMKKMKEEKEPPFDKPYKKTTGTVTDKSGAKHTVMSQVRDLARKALKKQAEKMKPMKSSIQESRKAEIVKDIVKSKKKQKKTSEDTYQPEPILTSQIVKEDK